MKHKGAFMIVGYLVFSAIFLSFIPPEQQLGKWLRLIIFHGNLSVASLYLIYFTGILGVAYLVTSKAAFAYWCAELGLQSVVIWFIGTALSFVSMQVAWGGLLWNEPRTIAALTITVLGAGKEYLLRSNSAKKRAYAWANLLFALAVVVIRYTLTSIMHPVNPIEQSESMLIRLLPTVFLVITFIFVILLASWRLSQTKNLS